jgi:hypothetical protein
MTPGIIAIKMVHYELILEVLIAFTAFYWSLASKYVMMLPEHIWQLLMHFEFTQGGEQMLKHCLANDRILKIGIDGSLNLWKETASFGGLLIGNKNVLVHGAGPVDGGCTYCHQLHKG